MGAAIVIIRRGRPKKELAKPLSGRNAQILMLAFT